MSKNLVVAFRKAGDYKVISPKCTSYVEAKLVKQEGERLSPPSVTQHGDPLLLDGQNLTLSKLLQLDGFEDWIRITDSMGRECAFNPHNVNCVAEIKSQNGSKDETYNRIYFSDHDDSLDTNEEFTVVKNAIDRKIGEEKSVQVFCDGKYERNVLILKGAIVSLHVGEKRNSMFVGNDGNINGVSLSKNYGFDPLNPKNAAIMDLFPKAEVLERHI